MLKKAIKLFILFAILPVVFYSCTTNIVFDQNVSMPQEGWHKNDAVAFNVNISDSLDTYRFELNIRNTTDYRYSNLYLFLKTELPNGNISRDTIECILANEEGKWLGKGWGNVKENDIILKSNLRFPLTGDYKFILQQAMRVDTLKGINDMGLSIVRE